MIRNWWPQGVDCTARPPQHRHVGARSGSEGSRTLADASGSDRVGRRRQSAHLSLERLETRTVPSFIPAVTFPVGLRPEAITVADLNTDGVQDIVVVNQGLPTNRESSLSVLLGDGAGSFRPAVTEFSAPRKWRPAPAPTALEDAFTATTD